MVFPEKDERVSGISQTKTGTVSEVTLGKLLRDVVERMWAFPGAEMPS